MSLPAICPSCQISRWRYSRQRSNILGLVPPYRVYVCRSCGLSCLHPIPNKDTVKSFYDRSYFEKKCASEADSFAPPTHGHDYSVAGVQRISLFAASLRRLNTLRPQSKSLLDVGAAYGHMVHLARSQGLQADGIELSDYAVQQAQDIYGITLFKCTLSEFTADALYDVIHLSHVFEHFVDPLIELSHLKRLLAPGGLIYIEVPFQFNLIERVLSFLPHPRVPFTLHSIHHPYFYTPPSIRKFFVDNGFEVLKLTLFDPMRYECDSLVKRIKRQIWRLLSFFGTGNYIEIIVIPKKGVA